MEATLRYGAGSGASRLISGNHPEYGRLELSAAQRAQSSPSEASPAGAWSARAPGGRASAGLAQFPDGDHYVVFDDRSVRRRYVNFLMDLANLSPPPIY